MINKIPKNKRESDKLINDLALNRVSEKVVYFDKPHWFNELQTYMEETCFDHYGMRSLKPGELFLYAIDRRYIIRNLFNFKEGVKICESMWYPDKDNLVLQGYISIDRNFNIMCEANDIGGQSLRKSMEVPKYKWYFSELEQKAPRILVNSGILDLMATYELFDVVVEFTYYDIPVGRNKEKLLIWEVRDY